MKNEYKRMSFYQIWTRSFCDGNGDGIGDLYGVYDKLDYVKSLGVDGIWFSPLYPSPDADYGYDVSDYRDIHPEFGDMAQFKKVLDRAHELGLKVIMDLVINHTSDEHMWFRESRKSRSNPYSDYYIWREKPNNWDSLFDGKAWEYDDVRGEYYLHIFAKKQPDLNMDNPEVRKEVEDIMRFWLDMGVDGFREDVINFISKKEGLPDDNPVMPAAKGMRYYKDGPRLLEYLAQFRKVAQEYGAIQIGEMPMVSLKNACRYLAGDTKCLDMIFNFSHMQADCFMTEYMHRPFNLVKLKRAFSKWQYALNGIAHNALYMENHDHPRIISRYGSADYHRESGTMLATCYLFQKGTPFVYQGQEIGMLNIRLDSIDAYKDVSTKNNYNSYHRREATEKRLERIWHSSRDSARTPMQWDDSEHAGFTTGKPWFTVNPNYEEINVAAQEADDNSILQFYRKCLKLRKGSRTLLYGDYKEYYPRHKQVYFYTRSYKGIHYLVICSFADRAVTVALPRLYADRKLYPVLGNYTMPEEPARMKELRLQAYETCVFRCRVTAGG